MTSTPVETWGTRGSRTYATSPGDNPLVVHASPRPAAGIDLGQNPFSGLRLVDDANQLAASIDGRDWVSTALSGAGAVMDGIAMATNPIAELIAMGVGWLLDHIQPLAGWLDDLTGDPAEVSAASQTWTNIGNTVTASGQQLLDSLRGSEDQAGLTIQAFRQLMADSAEHIQAAAGLANALGTGLQIASVIVQFVHDLVRDAIADIIGYIAQSLIEIAATAGLGLAAVIPQICELAANWARRLATDIEELIRSIGKLTKLLRDSDELLHTIRTIFTQLSTPHTKPHVDIPSTPPHTPHTDTPSPPRSQDPEPPAGGRPGGGSRTGDTRPSDGSGMAPGETATTMRGHNLRAPNAEEVARLDRLAADPASPVVKVDGHYQLEFPVDVHFDVDGFFKDAGIDPDSEYKAGVTWRQEYERQLALQQQGMNDLTVGEWQHNTTDYEARGRIGQREQAAARAEAGGLPHDGTAILHGPDQVAGGRPDTYDGLGSSRINSSIGRQWQDRIEGLQSDTGEGTFGLPEDLLPFIHMNVQLLSR